MLPIDVALIAESDGLLDAAAAPSSCARARPDAPNTQTTASAALTMLFIVAPHMKKRCNNHDANSASSAYVDVPHASRRSSPRQFPKVFRRLTHRHALRNGFLSRMSVVMCAFDSRIVNRVIPPPCHRAGQILHAERRSGFVTRMQPEWRNDRTRLPV
ncbi:hypothetical protein [Burkholderia contaminans]